MHMCYSCIAENLSKKENKRNACAEEFGSSLANYLGNRQVACEKCGIAEVYQKSACVISAFTVLERIRESNA